MVCIKCISEQNHEQNIINDKQSQLLFDRKYLEESFEKLIPMLNEEIDSDLKATIVNITGFRIRQQTQLIYKGTRDGFKATNFHSLCDNKGPNISYILSETGQVFGGYTSLSWKSPKWEHIKDQEALIFSLTKNTVHKQYQSFERALEHNKGCLMIFGKGQDIIIESECNNNQKSHCNLGGTYSLPNGYKFEEKQAKDYLAGAYNFKVIEIEVYSILT
ncbi:UNKNOWN [Stylonychia lemnae]|uniref:TLDc domain-containing protein n=1 Tax=Stylonychia lemnae TaxID=5949 RepID=A0A078BBZ5_STYLE|nr:UNKNOWN [Stylonychia lemnae]|eukprot:CDW90777.1 UNKNOWN [Stylonychia lemnae]